MKRHLAWDRLEGRDCPSHAGAAVVAPVPIPSPTAPIERTDMYSLLRHQADDAAAAAGRYPIVFLGDSITDYFKNGLGANVWQTRIAPLGAADFGIKGDASQNLLWRVENGELAGHPKVVVLMIGTNDLTLSRSADYTLQSIEPILTAIRQESPGSTIVLMGLLPRGEKYNDPLRLDVEAINAGLAALAPADGAIYLNIDAPFLRPDGNILHPMLPDGTHPSTKGYVVWAKAIEGLLAELVAAPKASSTTA